jgi:hypothetical protein
MPMQRKHKTFVLSDKLTYTPGVDRMAEDLVDRMKEDLMWLDIGPGKRALLKSHGFDVVGVQFIRRRKTEISALAFEHVREMPLATLRAELARLPSK